MLKPRGWPTSKLWVSTYQPLKRKYMSLGSPHPAWQCWKEGSTLGPKTPGWPRITGKCQRGKQVLHKWLAPVLEEADLFNMEQEIWEGIRKDPMAATNSARAPMPERAPSPKRIPSQMPQVEELPSFTSPDPPSIPKPEGVVAPQDLALVPRRWTPPPTLGSLPRTPMTLQCCL